MKKPRNGLLAAIFSCQIKRNRAEEEKLKDIPDSVHPYDNDGEDESVCSVLISYIHDTFLDELVQNLPQNTRKHVIKIC